MNFFKNTDQNLWYKAKEGPSRKFIDRNEYVRKKKILNYQCFLFLFQESRKKDNQTKSKENIRNKINDYDMITVLKELTVSCRKIHGKKNLKRSNLIFPTKDTNEVIFTLKLKSTIDPSLSTLFPLLVLPSANSSFRDFTVEMVTFKCHS